MRILHVDALASVPQRIAKAQRELGHDAKVLAIQDPRQVPVDIPVVLSGPWVEKGYTKLAMFDELMTIMREIDDYDIIHVHGGFGLPGLFYKWHKLLHPKKKFFLHFHGTELRKNQNTKFHNVAQKMFVISPDLLKCKEYVGGRELIWIPNPYHLNKVRFKLEWPQGAGKKVPLKIVHMPTHWETKGTKHVKAAVKKLKKKGYKIELDLVENRPYEEAMERLMEAHLCIDAVSDYIDAYGMVSIESMARGVPVICRHHSSDYDNCPVIPAMPDNLDKVIVGLLKKKKSEMSDISSEGRKYVDRVHHPKKIAKTLLKYYRQKP